MRGRVVIDKPSAREAKGRHASGRADSCGGAHVSPLQSKETSSSSVKESSHGNSMASSTFMRKQMRSAGPKSSMRQLAQLHLFCSGAMRLPCRSTMPVVASVKALL